MESPDLLEDVLFVIFDQLPAERKLSVSRSLSRYYCNKSETAYKDRVLTKPITVRELKDFLVEYDSDFALLVLYRYNSNGKHVIASNRYDIFMINVNNTNVDEDPYYVDDSWGANADHHMSMANALRSETFTLCPALNNILSKVTYEMLVLDPQTHYNLLLHRIQLFNLNIGREEIKRFVLKHYLKANTMIAEGSEQEWTLFWPEFIVRVMELKVDLQEGFELSMDNVTEDFFTVFDEIKRKL